MNYLHMGKFKNLNTKGTVLWPDLQNQSFFFKPIFSLCKCV